MIKKIWYTYDDIHRAIQKLAEKIKASGVRYDAMIAIGGGGFIPARMLRCFLDIPIYTVTTAYYQNERHSATLDKVEKIQWLDPIPEAIKGKNILIIDEVDDTRATLEFVLNELAKEDFKQIGIAVLHEKLKEKKGKLPKNTPYFSGIVVEDWWINYPWDADDIDEHNRLATQGSL